MAIPKYDEMYFDVLDALRDGEAHKVKEIRDFVAEKRGITPEDRRILLPSGKGKIYSSRINWTQIYLKKAGFLRRPVRGQYQLTEDGKALLENPPPILDNHYLAEHSASFHEWLRSGKRNSGRYPTETVPEQIPLLQTDETPDERMKQAFDEINDKLADDLLTEIMNKAPDFFEEMVIKLLLKMGYGGSMSDSGYKTQRTHDGGIDGVIREDKLGFDQIYIQAKRWEPETSISKPEIQKFWGALAEYKASKGLFITTAKFSKGAQEYAEHQRIVLVDGEHLAKLMIEYNIGVSTVATYEIKSIDSDFFNDIDD